MNAPPDGISWKGVRRVVRDWAGPGDLVDFFEATADSGERAWSRTNLENRAGWLQLKRNEHRLAQLPQTAQDWLNALPAASQRGRSIDDHPRARTDWVDTRVQHGWPPTAYINYTREKRKSAALRLVAQQAALPVANWAAAGRLLGGDVTTRTWRAADSLVEAFPHVESAAADEHDLAAAVSAGHPWGSLASIIRSDRQELDQLARGLVDPDPRLAPAMFHLGVLGDLVAHGESLGFRVVSDRPVVHARSPGPAYSLTRDNARCQIWSEAGGYWSASGTVQYYRQLRERAGLASASLSPDLLLATADKLVAIECKYSLSEQYAIRQGFHQASAYAVELQALSTDVAVYVVVPDGLLQRSASVTITAGVRIGLVPMSQVQSILDQEMTGDPPAF